MAKLFVVVVISCISLAAASSPPWCPAAMFWFGDSFADTGNVQAATPFVTGAEYPPYGMTYFGRPSNRFSDGRLLIDFFAQAFGYKSSSPSPLLQSLNSNYKHGVNFAASGATALNTSYVVPFCLPVQVDQYVKFVQEASKTHRHGRVPGPRQLSSALYVVTIGTNDLVGAYWRQGRTPENTSMTIVPQVVEAISHAVQTLYASGARNFMIFNTFPHGCMPMLLTWFTDLQKDSRGCLQAYNEVAETLNRSIYELVKDLDSKLPGSLLIYADVYTFTMEVLNRPADFGFRKETKTSACCGNGGSYNFNFSSLCGAGFQPEKTTLKPSEFVSWDGIHFTEAFYEHLAKALLAGKYLTPPLDFSASCKRRTL